MSEPQTVAPARDAPVRLDAGLHRLMKMQAASQGRTLGEVLATACREYLERKEQKR